MPCPPSRHPPPEQRAGRVRLSLSRLHHRLPGRQAHAEVGQGPTECQHEITDPLLPETEPLLHAAAALHAAVAMLAPAPATGQGLVGPLLLPGPRLASWLLGRPENGPGGPRPGQAAPRRPPSAPPRQGRGRRVRHGLSMATTAVGVTEEDKPPPRLAPQTILYRMGRVLAALTPRLCSRGWGAAAAPVGPVMGQRGTLRPRWG